MDELRRVADRIAFCMQPSEELPMLAAEALARGLDSPSLREAAGSSKSEVRDAHDCFLRALEELNIEVVNDDASFWRLVRQRCKEIVAGIVDPRVGADWIRSVSNRAAPEGDLRVFAGLAWEWEDHSDDRDEIAERIVDAARLLLERPEPRQWVMLRAERATWPLTNSKDSSRFASSDLLLSDELRRDVERWASDHRRQVSDRNRGPGGFRTQAASQAFAERGRVLAERLQNELGDGWQVEYSPNPTAFPNGRSLGRRRLCGGRQRSRFTNASPTHLPNLRGFGRLWRNRNTRKS